MGVQAVLALYWWHRLNHFRFLARQWLIKFMMYIYRDTNSMVEEFMLLANISTAQKIHEEFPNCAVLRRHPSPPASNFDPLIKAAQSKVTLFYNFSLSVVKKLL